MEYRENSLGWRCYKSHTEDGIDYFYVTTPDEQITGAFTKQQLLTIGFTIDDTEE